MRMTSFLGSILLLLILLNIGPELIQNIKEQYHRMSEPKTKIGRLKLVDITSDTSFYQQQLERFFTHEAIKAILLEIDSQGGPAGSSQILFNEIMHLKTQYKKPIVALIYNACTGSAYQIAIAADYIIAPPSAVIGNIGSYLEQLKQEKRFDHITLTQECIDDCAKQFIQDVAYRRGLSLNETTQWGHNHLFTGNQALNMHLIDAVGSEYTARQKIKELALIERDIEFVRPSHSWLAHLLTCVA